MQFNRLKLVGKYSFYGYFTFISLHKNNINIEILNFEKNYFKLNFNFVYIKHFNMCLPTHLSLHITKNKWGKVKK